MKPQDIVSCIDLTSLNDADTSESIKSLCQKATGPLGPVAAICCYSQFLVVARSTLSHNIPLATVVNFPLGQNSLATVEDEVRFVLAQGADEIDLVSRDATMVQSVKALCQGKSLKVIIESGELDAESVFRISLDCLHAGADFIKTSTGKTVVGATPEAVSAILKALKHYQHETGHLKGLKVSGGVKSIAQAEVYMDLAQAVFGKAYLQPKTFRIGASSLLDTLLHLHSV